MGYFPEAFDPSQVSSDSFELVPPGEYPAVVVEAEVKSPRSGDGYMLAVRYKISDGPYEGRLIFDNAVIQHSNETATKIGRARIKGLCDACGVQGAVKDTDEFLFKPVTIKVGIEKDKAGLYEDKNRILKILPAANGAHAPAAPAPVAAAQAAAPTSHAAPAAPGSVPWRR
jgi:hypothetical protein